MTHKECGSNHNRYQFYQQLPLLFFFFLFKKFKNDDYDGLLKCGIKLSSKNCFEQSNDFVHNLSDQKKNENQRIKNIIHDF